MADEEDTATEVPQVFELFQNQPNPFNQVTTISYVFYKTERVSLKVYDMLGSEVSVLIDEYQEAGNHEIVWHGTDNEGNQVSSGIYLYRLQAGGTEETSSMTLLR